MAVNGNAPPQTDQALVVWVRYTCAMPLSGPQADVQYCRSIHFLSSARLILSGRSMTGRLCGRCCVLDARSLDLLERMKLTRLLQMRSMPMASRAAYRMTSNLTIRGNKIFNSSMEKCKSTWRTEARASMRFRLRIWQRWLALGRTPMLPNSSN